MAYGPDITLVVATHKIISMSQNPVSALNYCPFGTDGWSTATRR